MVQKVAGSRPVSHPNDESLINHKISQTFFVLPNYRLKFFNYHCVRKPYLQMESQNNQSA